MKGILGLKKGMTQIFDEHGQAIPVTVIEAGPCAVIQVKTREKDGYHAIQLGFGENKETRLNKPLKGHLENSKTPLVKHLVELRLDDGEEFKVGQVLKADIFSVGDRTDVTGLSKGKGFTGVVKRWGFRGGPASHGSHFHRAPGSIGMCATPSRVHKGSGMAGRHGYLRVTVQNLEVIRVEPEINLLMVKGAVPGPIGNLVMIRSTVKHGRKHARTASA
jgi:large subunit ribosomal protein L3